MTVHMLITGSIFLVTPNLAWWHVVTALPRLWMQLGIPAAFLVIDGVARIWTADRLTPQQDDQDRWITIPAGVIKS